MYIAELSFAILDEHDQEAASHAINDLLGSFRMNGQICGREWCIAERSGSYVAFVLLPAQNALDIAFANKYVHKGLQAFAEAGLHFPIITLLGPDIDEVVPCSCIAPPSYILYTTYLALVPPLRCGKCFQQVPLYRLPKTYDDGYYDIVCWQSDYQSCDALQMNCRTLERSATRQLSRMDSTLSRQGIDICARITAATGVPTYYYLYRYGARGLKQERRRVCPSCQREWLLEEEWHLFDFKCDRCRLVSNIAWDVRY